MKPVKCPAKEKKWGEERKGKVQVKTAVSILRPKILLSARARTLQGNILHLDQQAAKCTTCKRLCGKFVKLYRLASSAFFDKISRGEWVNEFEKVLLPLILFYYTRGTQRQFSEYICSENDLRSNIFGTFVVKCY